MRVISRGGGFISPVMQEKPELEALQRNFYGGERL
jgi:hypothetical protein